MLARMNNFAQNDQATLSTKTAEHMEMVNGGDYAFVADETYLRFQMSQFSGLAIMEEKLAATGFAVGLQKN